MKYRKHAYTANFVSSQVRQEISYKPKCDDSCKIALKTMKCKHARSGNFVSSQAR